MIPPAWRCYFTATGREVDVGSAAILDEQSGETTRGSRKAGNYGRIGFQGWDSGPMPAITGDQGGASRFFYVAKPSRWERSAGCDGLDGGKTVSYGPSTDDADLATSVASWLTSKLEGVERKGSGVGRNAHPT